MCAVGDQAAAFEGLLALLPNTSGLSSSRNIRRASGIPAVRHSETDGCLTLQSSATFAVPPNLSMICESFMRQL